MSSPAFTFSSWRGRRAPSAHSQQRDSSAASASARDDARSATLSPPPPPAPGGSGGSGPAVATGGGAAAAATADTGGSSRQISSSYGSPSYREPIRSYIHGSVRDRSAPVDSAQYARSVREDTAELASYLLSDQSSRRETPSFLSRQRSNSRTTLREVTSSPSLAPVDHHLDDAEASASAAPSRDPDIIQEASEPPSPEPQQPQQHRRPHPHPHPHPHPPPPSSPPPPAVLAEGLPLGSDVGSGGGGPSILANMLRRSPPEIPGSLDELEDGSDWTDRAAHVPTIGTEQQYPQDLEQQRQARRGAEVEILSETSPLLGVRSHGSVRTVNGGGGGVGGGHGTVTVPILGGSRDRRDRDLESQKAAFPRRLQGWQASLGARARDLSHRAAVMRRVVCDPKCWDGKAIWHNVIVPPVACLPAVVVGLLLNILDALSYGMILFPLGNPIFANLGPAGISIFYVSTIISQLMYSSGSVFRGAVGSELIEVVPFFHSMASTITAIVGEDKPDAVIASTITAYALSAMLTGLVFFLMGYFQFGYIVGFIPRHILIGCIGGVGWFLVATGFEVSARIEGSLEYDLDTLHKLIAPDTVPLWITPLALAVVLFYCQQQFPKNRYILPAYIITIPAVFYFFVFSLDALEPDALRDAGWIFQGAAADEPWWYFYTLYKFDAVRWDAVAETVPAMFALTFFGILHVPINVPALAITTGEDNVDLNHELKLHGYSNFLAGCAGSIQNYLVYANTSFFIRTGADSRLAGFELAALTFGVMCVGPRIIGIIPVMMVGCLIFDLGFELILEALWSPRKQLKTVEYMTVVAIVLIMGVYDFVVGIGVGILMAFVSMIFQTSRVSAVRAGWSGDVVGSTVRRNPSQQHYLQQVGRQIYIIKLAGYLFFGTVVGVEERIRALIADEAFRERPIKFLVLDLNLVSGLDYSAGAAFNTISRLLEKKGVHLILSGVGESEGESGGGDGDGDGDSAVYQDLRTAGVVDKARLLPDLNSALESCENELLKTLYARQEAVQQHAAAAAAAAAAGGKPHQQQNQQQQQQTHTHTHTHSNSLEVPGTGGGHHHNQQQQQQQHHLSLDLLATSPRRNLLYQAAAVSINAGLNRQSKWQSFREPLRLMLQIFQDLSDKNEDFWFRAMSSFSRREFSAGEVIYRQDEPADGFYLLESGIVRMEYDLPQGFLCESIVAGTTCGELPFFSETRRTATAVVERDCVVWLMDREAWRELQGKEPDVARELLRMGLKLTSERMNVLTSYVLTVAG